MVLYGNKYHVNVTRDVLYITTLHHENFPSLVLSSKNLVLSRTPLLYTRLTKMAQRVTYRRRNPYNTKSNQIKVVKTPGGVLRAQHTKKRGTTPKCGDCGISLPGVVALRPREFSRAKKSDKTVSRAYGGSRCGNCVKERIIRAFLIEEQKIVQKVLKEQAEKEKQAEQN